MADVDKFIAGSGGRRGSRQRPADNLVEWTDLKAASCGRERAIFLGFSKQRDPSQATLRRRGVKCEE